MCFVFYFFAWTSTVNMITNYINKGKNVVIGEGSSMTQLAAPDAISSWRILMTVSKNYYQLDNCNLFFLVKITQCNFTSTHAMKSASVLPPWCYNLKLMKKQNIRVLICSIWWSWSQLVNSFIQIWCVPRTGRNWKT